MPTVHEGIGTWYYGKRRIHRRKGTCGFCQAVGELSSYDTTLYFVVFFVPLVPLKRYRVLEQCPSCRKHRVIGLKQWEESKAKDIATLLEKLEANPDDPETIQSGLGVAMAYQDEALFDKLAAALAGHRRDDAAIQTQLGDAYGYFARWPEAEDAYRAALAVRDDEGVRHQLALALLKQGRPEEARPYLESIITRRQKDAAGLIYLLIEGYQAQGLHTEALELMDRRDEAFPEWAETKPYKKQRKTSQRYQNSGKRVASAFLSESKQVGYREGSWTARLPRYVGPSVVLALLAWYLFGCVHLGQARKVYLVNGLTKPYTVAVNGQEHTLLPGAPTLLEMPEGDVVVESHDPKVKLEPLECRIETPFFSRPFRSRTFVLNPDRLAVLLWEQTEYAAVPRNAEVPPLLHAGQGMYEFKRVDYEFREFPQSLQVKQGQSITKTRVAVVPLLSSEARLNVLQQVLDHAGQIDYARRWLAVEPDDTRVFYWLFGQLPRAETLAYIKPRLADRPVRVEWHRLYQTLTELEHPESDLRPQYRQLVQETNRHPDAVYLLARLIDGEESDRLFREAATASPPSVHALRALGWQGLGSGDFAAAQKWLSKAYNFGAGDPLVRQGYRLALLANGNYDALLAESRARGAGPGTKLSVLFDELFIDAVKGDRAKAEQVIERALLAVPGPQAAAMRQTLKARLEMVVCCATNDTAGYLKQVPLLSDPPHFEPALLRGQLAAAAAEAGKDEHQASTRHALLYLAARKAKDAKLAEQQWSLMLAALAKATRHDRQLGEILAGRRPLNIAELRRLATDPDSKRVLLMVAAERFPKHAAELKALARKLDFQRDAVSLCLRRVIDK